jgi:hypothetical protein
MSREQWLLFDIQTRLAAIKEAREAERAAAEHIRESVTRAMAAQLIAETEFALKTAASD